MSNRHVEETIMQYTEFVYWDGDVVVATERMHDDRSYDVLETREPTETEINDYYKEADSE